MHTPHVLFSLCALVLLLGAAPDAEETGGRYKLTPADGGSFLRLDSQTGAMSVCQRKDAKWACEAIPDDRRALEAEIARLSGENKELQGNVKRLEELLALSDPEGRTGAHKGAAQDFSSPPRRRSTGRWTLPSA